MNYSYPVRIAEEDGEIGLIFPDFPEIVSWHMAEDVSAADLSALARDALLATLHARMSDNDDVPQPNRRAKADFYVSPGPLAALKLALYQELKARGLSRRDFAAKINKTPTMANRIFDVTHNSSVSQLEEAMSILDREFDLDVRIKARAEI